MAERRTEIPLAICGGYPEARLERSNAIKALAAALLKEKKTVIRAVCDETNNSQEDIDSNILRASFIVEEEV
jgi:hypothetical protein